MTRDTYRAHPALNFSSIKHLLRTPAHYQAALKTEVDETIDMRLGTNVHGWWLEGKTPAFVVKPEGMSFATKDGKAWRDAQTLPILTQDEADRQSRTCNALAANPTARHLQKILTHRETPLLHEIQGLPFKGLLDAHGCFQGAQIIADLKKCLSARPEDFGRTIMDRDYDLQAVLYCDLYSLEHSLDSPPDFVWIAVEDTPAACVSIFQITEEFRDSGRRKLERIIERYKECTASGEWPGYGIGIQHPIMPKWAKVI